MKDHIVFDDIDHKGPHSYSGTFDVAVPELGRDELAGLGPVTIEARADKGNMSGEYIVEGEATFTADLTCSRCVEPYPVASVSPFHVRFRPRPAGSEEEVDELEITDAGELDVEFYTDRTVSLRDLAVEQVLLTIPMKPLCDEGCLGLCPTCGANVASESCSCQTVEGDARWTALRGLRDELARKKDV